MKNKEKFAKEIIGIAVTGTSVAMRNGVLRECRGLCCSQCDFISGGKCDEKIKEWAESEYVEYETDWSKVPIDTPVLLKDNADNKRYFYKTLSDGALALFLNGRTSWSSIAEAGVIRYYYHSKSNVVLAREEDKLKYRKLVE